MSGWIKQMLLVLCVISPLHLWLRLQLWSSNRNPFTFLLKAFSKTERTCLAEGKHSLKMQLLIPQGNPSTMRGWGQQTNAQLYVLQRGLWEAFHGVVRGVIELLSPIGQLQPYTCVLAFPPSLAVSYSRFLVSPRKQTTWTQVLGFSCKGIPTETHFH